ncbi:MAG: DUF559 domain-containing protein [Desulfobacteraceae bacterium]|nr:DUF559 domain-containing protein [Desulfobacteraceae bacterium]
MISARKLKNELGYTEWRNFEGVIKRAISIIKHKHINGKIEKTSTIVDIGSGSKRKIVDYLLDKDALILLRELCSSFKLNNFYSIRNETVVLQLIEKYCRKRDIDFEYQFPIEKYLFDCKIGNKILIEFDESHHKINTRQKIIDHEKNTLAKTKGFNIYRVNIEMDIVDIIVYLENQL